ncbi:soyasapogenol B glucuronide galactosyltransferase [Trifolium repens]|nr:soyasapogenol B glucuronide galactosyltransferase [Trifolium repens]
MVRKQRRRSDAENNSVFLPMELIAEILSMLSVKAIVRFRCVCKSWNNLTYDSSFVDKHLKSSSRNPHLTLSWYQNNAKYMNVVPFPVHRLLKKPSATVPSDDFHRMESPSRLVGSCNGLLCFVSLKLTEEPFKYLLHISNPATRTRSQSFEFTFGYDFRFAFGYDASTKTYKVVAFRFKENSEVKVFNLGDNCWRNIQNFPGDLDHYFTEPRLNKGVHFCGTINWLALDKSITHTDQLVIVSLDLSTETYKQFMLPLGFNEMKEYGVRESWTQLFKISYQNLAMQIRILLPKKLPMDKIDRLVCLYVNGDIVIFASRCWEKSFIYNLKDKTVVKIIKSRNTIYWFYDSKDYVESLVSVY